MPSSAKSSSGAASARCPRVDRQAKAAAPPPSAPAGAVRGKTAKKPTDVQRARPSASAALMAAKKRARELQAEAGDGLFGGDGEKLHPKVVRAARGSGQLNLSGKGLESVPEQVWSLNEADEHAGASSGLVMDKIEDEEAWWDQGGNSVDFFMVKLLVFFAEGSRCKCRIR